MKKKKKMEQENKPKHAEHDEYMCGPQMLMLKVHWAMLTWAEIKIKTILLLKSFDEFINKHISGA